MAWHTVPKSDFNPWFPYATLSGLPNIPHGPEALRKAAAKSDWAERPRDPKKGGGWEYEFKSLPLDTRSVLLGRLLMQARAEAAAVHGWLNTIQDAFAALEADKANEAATAPASPRPAGVE